LLYLCMCVLRYKIFSALAATRSSTIFL
jgi:hypothetical protein